MLVVFDSQCIEMGMYSPKHTKGGKSMLERQEEQYLTKMVQSLGGLSLKLTSLIGIPDRLVLLPEGKVIFVELKRPGEKPRKIQEARMRQLKKLGFKTYVVDSYEQIDRLLIEVMRGGV